jgi:Na+/H+ antiporter NhaC
VIWAVVYFAGAVWFSWYLVRVLWVAATKGYVMALTRPFVDTVETPQTRQGNPQKFWANVVVALLLLPVAVGGLYLFGSELFEALTAGANV